jgi:succinate-semialdehyde dehydrogenase/glutarate-semialdehyde dehydrogenase
MSIELKNPELLRNRAYINGQWTAARSGKTFEVTNPANGEHLATVPDMDETDTRIAIESAEAAWPAWRSTPAKERAKILRKWFELLMENQEDLARLMTAEQGKPLAESRGEVGYGASFIEWFAEEAKRAYGDVIPSHGKDKRILVIKQPVGVVAAVTPWNFPIAMITRKVAPALAAGCPVVVKPAEDTPLSALAITALAEQAGVPAGLINIVTCSKPNAAAVGGELTGNPVVRKISFTGSTPVGKLLMRQASDTVKKVSLMQLSSG